MDAKALFDSLPSDEQQPSDPKALFDSLPEYNPPTPKAPAMPQGGATTAAAQQPVDGAREADAPKDDGPKAADAGWGDFLRRQSERTAALIHGGAEGVGIGGVGKRINAAIGAIGDDTYEQSLAKEDVKEKYLRDTYPVAYGMGAGVTSLAPFARVKSALTGGAKVASLAAQGAGLAGAQAAGRGGSAKEIVGAAATGAAFPVAGAAFPKITAAGATAAGAIDAATAPDEAGVAESLVGATSPLAATVASRGARKAAALAPDEARARADTERIVKQRLGAERDAAARRAAGARIPSDAELEASARGLWAQTHGEGQSRAEKMLRGVERKNINPDPDIDADLRFTDMSLERNNPQAMAEIRKVRKEWEAQGGDLAALDAVREKWVAAEVAKRRDAAQQQAASQSSHSEPAPLPDEVVARGVEDAIAQGRDNVRRTMTDYGIPESRSIAGEKRISDVVDLVRKVPLPGRYLRAGESTIRPEGGVLGRYLASRPGNAASGRPSGFMRPAEAASIYGDLRSQYERNSLDPKAAAGLTAGAGANATDDDIAALLSDPKFQEFLARMRQAAKDGKGTGTVVNAK